jgi:LPXTG-site transpeptidase (sortase) family protein
MKIHNIGYLVLIIGIIWTGYKYTNDRKEIVIEKNKIAYSLEEQTGYLKKEVDTYDAILSIPKINLKKGLYQKEDTRNNIDSNIAFHELSNYPDEDNGNVILMAHSGEGKTALFNDLDKLDTDSLIELYYQKTKYIYKIDDYYTIDKTGLASIKRDINKKTITLITCSQSDKTKQLVYIGYLIDEVKY